MGLALSCPTADTAYSVLHTALSSSAPPGGNFQVGLGVCVCMRMVGGERGWGWGSIPSPCPRAPKTSSPRSALRLREP
jgi:hypothetical protein